MKPCGECLIYGREIKDSEDAFETIRTMVIDDGVPQKINRNNLLNYDFT